MIDYVGGDDAESVAETIQDRWDSIR